MYRDYPVVVMSAETHVPRTKNIPATGGRTEKARIPRFARIAIGRCARISQIFLKHLDNANEGLEREEIEHPQYAYYSGTAWNTVYRVTCIRAFI